MASAGPSTHERSPGCQCDDSYSIYMIGCSKYPDSDTVGGPMQRYDMGERQWKKVDRPLPGGKRFNFAVTTVRNTIWVLGGATGVLDSIIKSVFVYDPVRNEWEDEKAMIHCKQGLCAAFIENRVYAIGGQSDTADGNTVEVYYKGMWVPSSPMRHRRHSFATAVAEYQIYAAGGIWNGEELMSVEYYSPLTFSWTVLSLRMPEPRAYFQLAVIGDKMYAVGGDAYQSIKSIDSMYTDGQWSTGAVHISRYLRNVVSVALNKDIYVVGWIFGHHDEGQLRILQLGDASTSLVANLPREIRFNGARLAVLKMQPFEAE